MFNAPCLRTFASRSRNAPETRSAVSRSARQHPARFLLVEPHGALELRGPDARVDLGRVDALMAEQRPHLFEIAVLAVHLHGHQAFVTEDQSIGRSIFTAASSTAVGSRAYR